MEAALANIRVALQQFLQAKIVDKRRVVEEFRACYDAAQEQLPVGFDNLPEVQKKQQEDRLIPYNNAINACRVAQDNKNRLINRLQRDMEGLIRGNPGNGVPNAGGVGGGKKRRLKTRRPLRR